MDEKPDNPGGDPQFYRDAIIAGFLESVASIEGIAPPEVIAKFRADGLAALEQQFAQRLWSKLERHKLIAFIDRLLERQGVAATDFEALYRRKLELDQKLFDLGDR